MSAFKPMPSRSRAMRWIKLILGNLIVFCLLALLVEAAFALIFHFPPGEAAWRAAQRYYLKHERENLMWTKRCGEYDPALTYRLHPNHVCTESTREYTFSVTSNSEGFRDDEASLSKPEIVMLGDSHLFGWGLNHDQLFSSLVEKNLGVPVLNLGIPSYATVRELRAFARIDRSHTKQLVIQYCDNDLQENDTFRAEGNKLSIMRKIDYQMRSHMHAEEGKERPYYLGKFTYRFFPELVNELKRTDHKPRKRAPKKEAREFLNVLKHSPVPLSDLDLVVFELDGYQTYGGGFVKAVKATLDKRDHGHVTFARSLRLIDLSDMLKRDDYFRYDDHLNAGGQAVVADVLTKVLSAPSPEPDSIRLFHPTIDEPIGAPDSSS